MERILYLTLKKKWFDMIESGEKKEEYREIKDYWIRRLIKCFGVVTPTIDFKEYDYVEFSNGYSATARKMKHKVKKISIGLGITKWGAPIHTNVFIISLGERVA